MKLQEKQYSYETIRAVHAYNLRQIVLTMVDRDDLADQGAAHVFATVQNLKKDGKLRVETLVGDFQGKLDLIGQVVASGMEQVIAPTRMLRMKQLKITK